MGVNISKQGIISASGNVNPNLLPNTSIVEKQCTYPSSSYKDWYIEYTIEPATGSIYILSFWAKSTVSGDIISSYFYSPNTTTSSVSSQGVTRTRVDGYMDFTLSTEWEFYWVIYTQSETTVKKRIICPRCFSSGTGTVSIRNVKLEEGSIPTPWIAAETDTNFVGAKCGFTEYGISPTKIHKECVEATEFIEI